MKKDKTAPEAHHTSTFNLQPSPLEPFDMLDDAAGALATFTGTVRNHHNGREVLRLVYEAYEAMAVSEGQKVLDAAMAKFDISCAHCVHRTGELAIGEAAIWIGVTAAHRGAAFDACRYIIDHIKETVPIWKKEYYADGEILWVNAADQPRADQPQADQQKAKTV